MNKLSKIILGVLAAMLVLLWAISGKYLDWLWFKSMGTTSVFWVSLITGPLFKLIIGLIVFGFFTVNFLIALKAFDRIKAVDSFWSNISKKTLLWPGLIVCGVLAFMIAAGFTVDWTVIQQFLHSFKTGVTEPTFNQDLGFYLFSYPFYQQLNTLLVILTFLGLAGTVLVYIMSKAFWRQGNTFEFWPQAKIHLTILTILFLGVKIWGYFLAKFGLLYQESTRLTGINYTGAHAKMFAYTALTFLLIGIILLLLYSLFRRGSKILIGSVIVWMAAAFILGFIYPWMMQTFMVMPNEYEMERPYLAKHINATRAAYGLDQIKVQPYTIQNNKSALLNIKDPSLADLRLWDYKPLVPSYNQLQAIGPYYEFNDVDIDRYPSLHGQRQVMLSARELKLSKLPEQAHGWINLHLTYTHGYGIAANQVNEYSSQGQPIFIAKNLPPEAAPEFPGLKVKEPRIYFGEATDQYIIVDTRTQEFDPDDGQDIRYNGPKGIPLSPFNKLVMSFKFQETGFILSSQLTGDSSVLMNRNIASRVRKLAPFLTFDDDPYLVVMGGELYWIIDAYTSSSYYPYAKAHGTENINYIRNSVKAVVNAYTGEVNYYITDAADPIIHIWKNIFPRLFKSNPPLELARHFRYPEYLLTIQRDMLLQYHMTNPKDFYEKEDSWDVPTENYSGVDELFAPYYVTAKLPGETAAEFVMMQPFTPRNKQNLISWLVGRCDPPNYGKLVLYTLPTDQNIYGPTQIESRIAQDPTISQLITLWNQQQSQVVWGNLLFVPIDGTLLYVKPLFLESGRSRQAELKKVVMVYQNQVLLGNTVAQALENFSTNLPAQIGVSETVTDTKAQRRAEILKRLEEIVKEQQRLIQELGKQ
jgi:uncharacterized membrane protein (UPF0182 family)